jgi:peptide chain release factor 3
LTEKLLLFGGAIQLAGEVRARGERRRVRSVWMAVERERGISISSAVMSFEHEGLAFNLLDTPGHQDFSPLGFQRGHLPHPDRGPPTLTLPRSRGRVREGATRRRPQWRQGGIEEQTRKLFEVGRLRDVPIITFVNKLDREGRDPFDLLDEIEQSLALDVTPASWPIGMERDFSRNLCLLRRCTLAVRARRPTGWSSRSAPAASTTRNCRSSCQRRHSANRARRSRWRRSCARLSTRRPPARGI